MAKRVFLFFFKFICAGLCALIILSGFSLFYGYPGIHIENKTGATDYVWLPNSFHSNSTEGNAYIKTDKNGFNNTKPINKRNKDFNNIDVLLMGSSHMEAFNVVQTKNTCCLLNEMFVKKNLDLYCYNIGISGHTFTRCVHNINEAIKEYSPSKYVIIETMSVLPDEKEMMDILNGKYKKLESYNSKIMTLLQKIPCFRSIYKKTLALLEINADKEDEDKTKASTKPSEYYNDVLNDFLIFAKHSCKSKKLIIFYHPTLKLQYDGKAFTDTNGVEQFRNACQNAGITFVDMTDMFLQNYYQNHTAPHGFNNTACAVGHLNEYGHRMIAAKLFDTIERSEGK